MKKGSLSAPLLLLCFYLEAQQTFSVKFDLGSNTIAGALFETNDGFLIIGTGGDTLGPTHTDMFILKTNNMGDTMSLFHWGEPDNECFARTKAQGVFSDSTYLTACLVVQQGPNECMLFWFNNDGDTLKTMHFPSPAVDENEFVETRHLVVDPVEDCFYLSLGIYRPNTQNDYIVQKRTKEGELVWEVYTDGPLTEASACLISDSSGIIISEYGSINSEYYHLVKKISSSGELVWSFPFQSEDIALGPMDMIFENDGLVCSSLGSPPDTLFSSPILFKLDTLGNFIWTTHTPNSYTSSYQYMENLTRTCDGGYVGAARRNVPIDGINVPGMHYNYAAWIIRYDEHGSILWDRKFSDVNSERYNHEIYDIISTRDGGIAFCGEATDHWSANPNLDAPAQQAWIMKLDACGCLVPGCDSLCTPPDCSPPVLVPDGNYFLFGPNPVSQMLNIFVGKEISDGRFVIYDSLGKIVQEFSFTEGDITYMWDLESLAKGTYFLSLEQGDEKLQVERIIKQ